MTRLYRLDAAARDIADAFGARVRDDPWAGGYVAPDKFAPVITAGRDFVAGPRPAGRALQPRMVPRLWGVQPPPNSDDPTRRIGTLRNPESPFWIGNLRNSEFRCLIPATAVMIWGSGTDYEGRRLKHWIALEGAPIFGMLGVWKDEEVPAFALVTKEASGLPHSLGAAAMPVCVPPSGKLAQTWLHGGWDRVRGLLEAPTPPALIEIAPPVR
ncbi:MAG: DUF159 family protein [Pseudomonadota bacterium]